MLVAFYRYTQISHNGMTKCHKKPLKHVSICKLLKCVRCKLEVLPCRKINSALHTDVEELTCEQESDKSSFNVKTSKASVSACFFPESILNL